MTDTERKRRKGQKKLELWIDEILHHTIKLQAVSQNISMKKYVLQAIISRMVHDEELNK